MSTYKQGSENNDPRVISLMAKAVAELFGTFFLTSFILGSVGKFKFIQQSALLNHITFFSKSK